jgi:pimeloyl-ACP methyl ester carboxylesterase
MLLGEVSRPVTSQQAVLPPRTDLRTRRERVAARVMVRGLDLYERLTSRVLVDVTCPGEDPFYRVPEKLEAFRPGEVLDARPVEVRGFRRVIRADAWQVKFRSTDTRGAAVSGVTTVMIPRRPFNGSVRPLLSYQCAIDSLGAAANPSYTLRHGNQWELPFMARALRRGWAVVTTDYTGPRHAFAAALLAARFVLDGIRAVIAFEPAGFDAATPIGLWGYSGGAQATLCAAEQHPGYAPELNIVGAAAGGITVDPTTTTGTFEDVYDGSLLSGIPLGAIIGISREFPDVDLLGALTPQGQAMVASAAEMTADQLFMSFPFLHWGDYLAGPSVLDIPGLRAAFEANRFGQATPTTPLYLYHGVHEQNLPIADADKFVETYRREGADVTYHRIRFGEHMIVTVTGVPGALRFLSKQFGAQ